MLPRIRPLALLLAVFTTNALAYPLTEVKLLPEDVVSVYDGDTLTVKIDMLPDVFGRDISVRIRAIDTPEIRSECGTKDQRAKETMMAKQVRDYLVGKIAQSKRVTLSDLDRDKYFRLLATVSLDGVSVADDLIAQGMAVPYDGGTKVGWCQL
ncbi:hypothetical protein D3C78_301970 [compost metagenome]